MSFLHEFSPQKYVHGDLRPNNVLLGTNMEPYISDFDLGDLQTSLEGRLLCNQIESPVVLPETKQMDFVQWVQFGIKEKKPSADVTLSLPETQNGRTR
ncbi:hypothetical protein PR202_gb25910 [Eleusine coracana subsp. coracana]|uniref:Protein kinase domain-containing protein n=1 Tax=Eleusine coracana subsp. coracana TaxID=191504 RepID=A0AAV5FQJ1_ELECO|nr:hypothetical protein PR202_gb25910 [Eleusine coracana subsp. coracana]